MRFMVLVKANPDSEAGVMPDPAILTAMSKYNEELAKAGVLLDLSGLHPTKNAKRVKFTGATKRTVIDGPFAEAKELIAGYWILECKSWEECVEWVKRAPMEDTELEIRQIFELSDFELTPDQRETFEKTEARLKDRPRP